MSEKNFTSGQWTGFYNYSKSSGRFPMDLILEFHGGVISGEGADGIGAFRIDGHYSSAAGECSWVKTYVGKHAVAYTGYGEDKGIWGTWTIAGASGGFHIWPLGETPPMDSEKEEAEETLPLRTSPHQPPAVAPASRDRIDVASTGCRGDIGPPPAAA